MDTVARVIEAIEVGEPTAAGRLLPLVYEELRRMAAAQMARERPGQTLDATGLVHEAYLRLVGQSDFSGKSHFFRAAAEAMRRVLIDNARRKRSLKRGGVGHKIELSESDRVTFPDPDTLLTIDEALTRLSGEDANAAEIARLRLFAGVSIDEAADMLGISRATAFRDWQYARAVLSAALQGEKKSSDS